MLLLAKNAAAVEFPVWANVAQLLWRYTVTNQSLQTCMWKGEHLPWQLSRIPKIGRLKPSSSTSGRKVRIRQAAHARYRSTRRASYVFQNCAHAAARFCLEDAGNIYGRLTNSTQEVLEKRLAALEGGAAALATASGAAAISYTIQALAQAGEHIVAQKTIYGGTYNLLAHTLPQYRNNDLFCGCT